MHLEQLLLAARRAQAKPAQQHQPGAAEAAAAQKPDASQTDRHPSEETAAGVGHLHAPPLAAAHLPHQRLHD
ncbi:MAG: hypothetical protein ACK55I_06010, partial [bacterium]